MCESESKSSPGDTPLKLNSVATGVFLHGTLQDQRFALLADFGNIPEVTVDFMLDHIVPNSGINVERTIQNLRLEGVYSMLVGKNSLVHCPNSPPTTNRKFLRKWELFIGESLHRPSLMWDHLHVLLHWS